MEHLQHLSLLGKLHNARPGEFGDPVFATLRIRQHTLEAFHGFIGSENHPVTLARQVQDIRLLGPELHQPVEHRLRSRDLETRAEGPAAVTLAIALRSALRKRGHPVVHLDGEFLRELMGNKDFSEAGRIRNIKTAQQLAAKLNSEGIEVVASFVSPYREIREEFKRTHQVLEIHVHTTEVRGKEAYFVANFEPPQQDFLDIDTTNVSVESCVQKILHAPAAEHR